MLLRMTWWNTVDRIFTKEEWLRLIESVDNYRNKLIVKLLYSTGMRVGELAKLKIPITAVQKQVGHKKLTTTQIYSNLAPEQVREAYEGVKCIK